MRLRRAVKPGLPKPHLQSCLTESNAPVHSKERYNPDSPEELAEFTRQLHANLAYLACSNPDIAWGLIRSIRFVKVEDKVEWKLRQIEYGFGNGDSVEIKQNPRSGLEVLLSKHLDDCDCKGLQNLSEQEKREIREPDSLDGEAGPMF